MTPFLEALTGVDPSTRCLRNTSRDVLLASSVRAVLDSGGRRGPRHRAEFEPGRALIAAPCRAVHTMGTDFAIDVAFVDRMGRIVGARHALAPWRLAWHRQAAAVVELPSGTLARTGTTRGDQLAIEACHPQG